MLVCEKLLKTCSKTVIYYVSLISTYDSVVIGVGASGCFAMVLIKVSLRL